jgi:hypothetical protein
VGQFAPAWAAGSYASIQDDLFGKLVYRHFAVATFWTARYVKDGDAFYRGRVRYFEEGRELKQTKAGMAGFFGNGMGYFKEVTFGFDRCQVDFDFKTSGKLDALRFSGERAGTGAGASLESYLGGISSEVPIPDPIKREILSRASAPGWMASGGPYSPGKLLARAYEGCVAQFPLPSQNPARGDEAERANRACLDGFRAKAIEWGVFIREAGVDPKDNIFTIAKPVPLGMVVTKEELSALPPISQAKTPSQAIVPGSADKAATASAQQPTLSGNTGDGGIVIREGAPLYKDATGDKIRFHLKKGDAVAAWSDVPGKALDVDSQFRTIAGRYKVTCFENEKSARIGWIDPADIAPFRYECCTPGCSPVSGVLSVKWTDCFIKARDAKRSELGR